MNNSKEKRKECCMGCMILVKPGPELVALHTQKSSVEVGNNSS